MDAATNSKRRAGVEKNWRLGPKVASVEPTANAPYWADMGRVWSISAKAARRQLCANCEYFNNTPEMHATMESVPLDALDRDGGGRGFCEKFDFICHNLRTCQAWERKSFEEPDAEEPAPLSALFKGVA